MGLSIGVAFAAQLEIVFGMMALLYLLFSKFVPMISIWEMKVGLQAHGGVPMVAPADP